MEPNNPMELKTEVKENAPKSKWKAIVAALVVVVVLAGGVFYFSQKEGLEDEAPPSLSAASQFKGFIKGGDFDFYLWETDDVDAFDIYSEEKSAQQVEPVDILGQGAVNSIVATMPYESFKAVLQNVDYAAEEIAVAKWSPEERKFLIAGGTGYYDPDWIKEIDIEDPVAGRIEQGETFYIVVKNDSEGYGYDHMTEPNPTPSDLCTFGKQGWNQYWSSESPYASLSGCFDEVVSIYLQDGMATYRTKIYTRGEQTEQEIEQLRIPNLVAENDSNTAYAAVGDYYGVWVLFENDPEASTTPPDVIPDDGSTTGTTDTSTDTDTSTVPVDTSTSTDTSTVPDTTLPNTCGDGTYDPDTEDCDSDDVYCIACLCESGYAADGQGSCELAPLILSANPGNQTAYLRWDTPTGTDITTFEISVHPEKSALDVKKLKIGYDEYLEGTNGPGYLFSGLTNDVAYIFQVAGMNDASQVLTKSQEVKVVPKSLTLVPNIVTFELAAQVYGGKISIDWKDVPNAAYYELVYWERGMTEKEGKLLQTKESAYLLDESHVNNNTQYVIKAYAKNADGDLVGESKEIVRETGQTLTLLQSFKMGATALNGSITAEWESITGASFYEVVYWERALSEKDAGHGKTQDQVYQIAENQLEDQTDYVIKVYAYDSASEKIGVSNSVSVNSGLTLVPLPSVWKADAAALGDDVIEVKWEDTRKLDIDYYEVSYKKGTENFGNANKTDLKRLTVYPLEPATEYTFQIQGFDSSGAKTGESVTTSAKTTVAQPADFNVDAEGGDKSIRVAFKSIIDSTKVDSYWIYYWEPDMTGSKIQYKVLKASEVEQGTTTLIEGLKEETVYRVHVIAKDANKDNVGDSNKVTVSTKALGSELNVQTSSTENSITISYNSLANAKYYKVYLYAPQIDGTFPKLATRGYRIQETEYTFGSLKAGTNYQVAVKAYDATPSIIATTGRVEVSTSETLIPLATEPKVPTNLTASLEFGSKYVDIDWDANGNSKDVSYIVKRYDPVNTSDTITITNPVVYDTRIGATTNFFDIGKEYVIEVVATLDGKRSDPVTIRYTRQQQLTQALNITATTTINNIGLSWDDISGAVRYNISQKNPDGTLKRYSTASTAYEITGLNAGDTYEFTVTAVDSNGTTLATGTKNVTTKALTLPSNTDLNITPSAITSSGFTLSWDEVTDATKYTITESGHLGVTINTLSQEFRNRLPGTAYTITVIAKNDANEEITREEITVTTTAAAATNTDLNITPSAITSSGFILTWDEITGATDYAIVVSGANSEFISATSAKVIGLNPETTYEATVIAKDSTGTEVVRDTISVTTTAEYSDTLNVQVAETTSDGFTLTWSPIEGATNYIVDVVGVTGGVIDGNSFTIGDLLPGTAYEVSVRATNNSGAVSQQEDLSVTTLDCPQGYVLINNECATIERPDTTVDGSLQLSDPQQLEKNLELKEPLPGEDILDPQL